MKATTSSLDRRGGREENRCGFQDVVRPTQLTHLTLQLSDPLRIRRRRPRPAARVDLGLVHPAPQRLRADAQLARDRAIAAPCFSPVSRRISNTIRTARSRSSSGYFCGLDRSPLLAMLHPHFQGTEPPRIPGRFRLIETAPADCGCAICVPWMGPPGFVNNPRRAPERPLCHADWGQPLLGHGCDTRSWLSRRDHRVAHVRRSPRPVRRRELSSRALSSRASRRARGFVFAVGAPRSTSRRWPTTGEVGAMPRSGSLPSTISRSRREAPTRVTTSLRSPCATGRSTPGRMSLDVEIDGGEETSVIARALAECWPTTQP